MNIPHFTGPPVPDLIVSESECPGWTATNLRGKAMAENNGNPLTTRR